MRKIRIVSSPEGEAPEWVRSDWVGVDLPVVTNEPITDPNSRGVVTGEVAEMTGALVDTKDAVYALLEAGRVEAALWWVENRRSKPDIPDLLFEKSCYEVIE